MIMTTKMKTEAAAMISCYDHKKKYDMYCKKLLSNKQILAYVMKGCVPEYADTPLEDIPSYIEKETNTCCQKNQPYTRNANLRNQPVTDVITMQSTQIDEGVLIMVHKNETKENRKPNEQQ